MKKKGESVRTPHILTVYYTVFLLFFCLTTALAGCGDKKQGRDFNYDKKNASTATPDPALTGGRKEVGRQ